MIKRLLVIDHEHRSADAFQGVAGKRPFEHDFFVAEPFALGRQPEMRLLGGSADLIGRGNAAGPRTIRGLHLRAFLPAANGPGHLDAVAGLARLREAVRIGKAEIFLTHGFVVKEAARRNDGRLGTDGDLVARFVRRFNADHAAVFGNELLSPSVRQKRLPGFLVLVDKEVDPTRTAALVNVPGVQTVGIVGKELFELHAVLDHPVNRVGGAVNEGPDHARIAAPMTVIHDFHECFVFGETVVPVALHSTLNGKDAFGIFAGAARKTRLFKRDDLHALFGGCPGSCGAGRTRADYAEVGFISRIRSKCRIHHHDCCRGSSRNRELFHSCSPLNQRASLETRALFQRKSVDQQDKFRL